MGKPNKLVDIIIVFISLCLIGQIWFWPIIGGSVLALNYNLILALLVLSFLFKRHGYRKVQVAIFFILLLFLCGLLNFTIEVDNSDLTQTSFSANIGSLSFDPIVFLLLLVYCLINKGAIKYFINRAFYETEEEKSDSESKQTAFYYDQFNTCTEEELERYFKMYKEYPIAAQSALKRIKQERQLAYEI
jgi:hypothetical protein